MLFINIQKPKSDIRKRTKYLLGNKGDRQGAREIFDKDIELFEKSVNLNNRKNKYFNILVSFEESPKEIKERFTDEELKQIVEEIMQITFLSEKLNYIAIEHTDTDNYHLHITLENHIYENDRAIELHHIDMHLRAIKEYISQKYQVSLSTDKQSIRTKETGSLLNRFKSNREKIKEQIDEIVYSLVRTNQVKSREDLIHFFQDNEIDISRVGKHYITIVLNNKKYRLKGGIYSDERFEEVRAEILSASERNNKTSNERSFERAKEQLIKSIRKRQKFLESKGHNLNSIDSIIAIVESSTSISNKATEKSVLSTKKNRQSVLSSARKITPSPSVCNTQKKKKKILLTSDKKKAEEFIRIAGKEYEIIELKNIYQMKVKYPKEFQNLLKNLKENEFDVFVKDEKDEILFKYQVENFVLKPLNLTFFDVNIYDYQDYEDLEREKRIKERKKNEKKRELKEDIELKELIQNKNKRRRRRERR